MLQHCTGYYQKTGGLPDTAILPPQANGTRNTLARDIVMIKQLVSTLYPYI